MRIEQDLAWNIGGARNLLVAMAPTEHVLLMDMDTRVPEALAAQLHTLVPKMTALEHASEKGHVFVHFPSSARNIIAPRLRAPLTPL